MDQSVNPQLQRCLEFQNCRFLYQGGVTEGIYSTEVACKDMVM